MTHRMPSDDQWRRNKHPEGERAIKHIDRYQTRVYTGSDTFILARRGSQRVLEAGDVFHIRPASSDVGWRVVLDGETSKIFSVTGPADMETLTENSRPWEN